MWDTAGLMDWKEMRKTWHLRPCFYCRGGRTRTADPRVPNAVRYRTALRPERYEYNGQVGKSQGLKFRC
jgi:hypothetical protein